jgi:hypothetical protein
MTFRGFNVKYPEYEIITPQTKLSFTLRSLNVQEEENLKGSYLTSTKMSEHLNKCLYDVLVKKPDSIKDYDSFLRNVTIKDREALLYGLFHITYEDVRNYEVNCPSCDREFPITVKMSETFNFTEYPGNDVLTARKSVELPKTKGVFVTIKQPTLFDEITAMKQLSSRPSSTLDAISETLIIDKFEQTPEESISPTEFTDKEDIIDAYLMLPAKDKRTIFNTYMDNFGKYGIELKMKYDCASCGATNVYNIELVGNFFRAMHSLR